MANVKTKGIILSEHNLGDFDKMLTMLTPGTGVISCVAKGARRPKSALLAPTQMFCFADYVMYKGTSTYHINSAETIEMFYNIRTDLDKLKYAVHINKIILDVVHEDQNSYRILQLLLNTLYTISETDKDLDFVLSVFKLRLLTLLGFTPRYNRCSCCNKENNITNFSVRYDGIECENCARADKSAIYISESTLNAIKYTIMAPAKKLYSFNLKGESLKEFNLLVKIYFNEKLEKEYKIEDIF